ncbi:hypothetical protein [Streptomyces sp. 21So2-11]|uniref:hypothetical protein n=1 Tax=Streptomyces sp. 21So2-11 TaxID=3144408 RepID=UPI00321AC077
MVAAVLIAGSTAGATFAAEADRTAKAAEAFLPTVDITSNFAVVATPHWDTVGCNGYKVVGKGTSIGKPLPNGGTWTQEEEACTATVPGKWDIKAKATITEPDGDKLNITYHLTAPVTQSNMVHPVGTFTITGGVGNYEFATGGGKMKARVNLLDHDHVSSTLVGDIQYLG